MAKKTCLQLFNRLLDKIGDSTIATFTNLSKRQTMAFDKLNDAFYTLYSFNSNRWKFAEVQGTITLTAGTSTYSSPTDMAEEDIFTFRYATNDNHLTYYDEEEFINRYHVINGTGTPDAFTRKGSVFVFNRIPGASDANRVIDYRYWKIPTQFSTATATATCDIPEQFEIDALVNLAAFDILTGEGDSEAQSFYFKLYGTPDRKEVGFLRRMKRLYGSTKLDNLPVTNTF